MNGFGHHNSLVNEMNYRVGELQREAKQARLIKAVTDTKPTLFKRLALSLMTLVQTTHAQVNEAVTNENLGQPALKRTTATFTKV